MVHFYTQLFGEDSECYCGNAHTLKDAHLKAKNELLESAFFILVRGGSIKENPVVIVRGELHGKRICKELKFNVGQVRRALEKGIHEAWKTGEYDEYLNTSIEEAWGSLEENPDLQRIIECML